jgi:two-component system KDP operon response regulator KdpE
MDSRVLVIEDEIQIRRILKNALTDEGCHVSEAGTVKEGLRLVGTTHPELILLDLGLPDGDGIGFIEEVRGWSDIPILILSARFDEKDKIAGLNAGADDYLTKPFGVGELIARIRALLRRKPRLEDEISPVVQFGHCSVDFSTREVLRAGEEIHLTPIEYKLLTVMLSRPDKVMTQTHILKTVWGDSYAESTHYLRIYMSHLRQKLEDNPSQPKHFLTEIGVGYRFKQ